MTVTLPAAITPSPAFQPVPGQRIDPELARSWLLVNAAQPERFQPAEDSAADIVILDIEDAVAPKDKDQARADAVAWLTSGHTGWVRLNGYGSRWWEEDVDALAAALAAHPHVSWVQLPFAGIEPFVPLVRSHPDIVWTSAKGAYAPPVAEHALLLTLALLRDLPARVRATTWGPSSGRTLNGLTAVVVGGGGIAQEYIRLLKTWDVHVTAVRRRAGDVPGADRTVTTDRLDEVLPGAQVVMIAAAATEETRGMFDADRLALLDEDAVLVNVARGALVDTDAVVQALAAGRLHGYGTDVTDPEPLPDGHPLWAEERALITPHTADTPEMCVPLLHARVERNLRARAAGTELEGLVDAEGGY